MIKIGYKKYFLIISAVLLIAWGKVGHEAIGYIAAAHLTPKTTAAVKDLLGNETLADVSTYADEIRPDSFFQFTGPWHYIDVHANENFEQFKQSVFSQTSSNLYLALNHWQRVLADPATNRSVKIFALKMVVHLVGDLHQPLHVARTEDKGGNLVPVWFNGESTNLHALWDSKLIEHTGLTAVDLAGKWDFATPEDITNWQADPQITWLYESNHISNQIYEDPHLGEKLGQGYYDQYIGLIRQRIDQAGIRLAGILNLSFDPKNTVDGQRDTTICDKVFDGKFLESSQITFLNLGSAYPNQKISVVIKGADRDKFKPAPEIQYAGKNICVTGIFEMYKGRPEIIVTDPKQILLK